MSAYDTIRSYFKPNTNSLSEGTEPKRRKRDIVKAFFKKALKSNKDKPFAIFLESNTAGSEGELFKSNIEDSNTEQQYAKRSLSKDDQNSHHEDSTIVPDIDFRDETFEHYVNQAEAFSMELDLTHEGDSILSVQYKEFIENGRSAVKDTNEVPTSYEEFKAPLNLEFSPSPELGPTNGNLDLKYFDNKENCSLTESDESYHEKYQHSFTLEPPKHWNKEYHRKWERSQMLRHTASKNDLSLLRAKRSETDNKSNTSVNMKPEFTKSALSLKPEFTKSALSLKPEDVQIIANVTEFFKSVGSLLSPEKDVESTEASPKSTKSPAKKANFLPLNINNTDISKANIISRNTNFNTIKYLP